MTFENLSKNKIKQITALRLKKKRDETSTYLIEGKKFVLDIASYYPERLEYVISYREDLLTEVLQKKIIDNRLLLCTEEEFRQMSNLQEPSGLMAIAAKQESQPLREDNQGPLMICDRIQDPSNLGAIIRTCNWFGIKNIVLLKGCSDPFNPKVVQTSAASVADVNIILYDHQDLILELTKRKYTCYALDMEGRPLHTIQSPTLAPWCLIVGNEGQGLSESLKQLGATPLSIPSIGSTITDSLNAVVSTSIALHHLLHAHIRSHP